MLVNTTGLRDTNMEDFIMFTRLAFNLVLDACVFGCIIMLVLT
jgi:hypothetical protein